MGFYAADHIRARISKARVAEMLARGWCIIGPAEEGALLMEGPDPDLDPRLDAAPEPLAPLFQGFVARARARQERRAERRVRETV